MPTEKNSKIQENIAWNTFLEEYQDDALLTNNVGTKVAIISGTTGNDANESGFSNSKLLDSTSLKRDHERLTVNNNLPKFWDLVSIGTKVMF